MKKLAFWILLTAFLFLLAGCSHKQLYDSIQYSQKNECQKLPESQYRECLENVSKPYDQYEKERQEIYTK